MLSLTIRGLVFSALPCLLVFSPVQARDDRPIQNLAVPLPSASPKPFPTRPSDVRDQHAVHAINHPPERQFPLQEQQQQRPEKEETVSSLPTDHPTLAEAELQYNLRPSLIDQRTLAETLSDRLAEYALRHWGFVIIRTTYSSAAKWAEFLAIINDHIRFWCFHPSNKAQSHLYGKHVLTVLQNAATLSDANFALTARVFKNWTMSPEARAERAGTEIDDRNPYSTRYHFFIHADEETVERVLAEHAKRKPVPEEDHRSHYILSPPYQYQDENRFAVKVVYATQVENQQKDILERLGPDANTDLSEEEEEDDVLPEWLKRVRISEIPELYAVLGEQLDTWFNIYTNDANVCFI